MLSVDQNKTIRKTAAYLVEELMRENKYSKEEALNELIKTTTYEALLDIETDLWLESKEFVLDVLKAELKGNPYRLLAI